MEEHFINYNQALALRELGFDQPCFAFYDAYNGNSYLFFELRTEPHWIVRIIRALTNRQPLSIKTLNQDHLEYLEGCCSVLAPLKSQVFKFFRDKYKIQGFIKSYTVRGGNGSQNFCDYIYVINGIGMNVIQTDARDSQFKTYEEAESACIDKLISIIKEKKS